MKGLFVKDFCFVMKRKNTLLIMVCLCVMYMLLGMGSFALAFMTWMGAAVMMSTLAYDAMNRGLSYLFSLPISRREYVYEKYLLCVIGGTLGMAIGLFTAVAGSLFGIEEIQLSEILPIAFVGYVFMFVFCSIFIPVDIKFGAEQSRIVTFGIMFVIVIIGVVASKFVSEEMIDDAFTYIGNLPLPIVGLTGLVIGAIFMVVSAIISVCIIEKKEF
ncbi:MAG: ABC-2 transporter permease [Lachnospiraceae bacterium]|nr:ABC-2 transporter permease [Lachnospiraceae bacterium]